MAVKIKLKRLGKIRNPQYRIIVADSRTKRDGRAIEEIGVYHPKEDPSLIRVNSERAQYWLGVGAKPTEPVEKILKITGDWQKFKGEPGAEGTLKVAEPKPDRHALYEAAAKEVVEGDATGTAAAPKKKRPKKSEKSEKTDKGDRAEKPAKVEADKSEKTEKAEAEKPEGGKSAEPESAESEPAAKPEPAAKSEEAEA